jgi:DNA-binding Lrp family transcriptional regulator
MRAGRAAGPWSTPNRRAVGKALIAAGDQPMTAREIAYALGKDPSNIRQIAKELADEGLLRKLAPVSNATRRGRRPELAFTLAADQRDAIERILREPPPTSPASVQQLVFVEVPPRLENLLEVLGDAELMAQATWSAVCDGDRQEYVIVFDGGASHQPVLDLMAVLSAAALPHRRASISQIRPAAQLARQAQRARRTAAARFARGA